MEAIPAVRLLSVTTVAKRFATSVDRVRDLIHAGHLSAVDIRAAGAKRATFRITEESVNAFLQARSLQRPAKPAKKRAKYVPQILK